MLLQPALQLTDADSAALASATVAFTVGHNAGTDELAVDTDAYGSATLPGAMTTSYDAVAGVLTLSGAASPFEYEAVLRAVAWRYTAPAGGAPWVEERGVAVTASDGADSSDALTRTAYRLKDDGATPVVAYVEPADTMPTYGGRVALVGANFGDGSTLETATLGFKLMTGCSVTTAGSVIECDVPAGAGENIEVRVQVDGALSQDDNELFSYGAPTVLSASSVPSTGGLVTVTGTNFGPLGDAFVDWVRLDGVTCSGAQVTVAQTSASDTSVLTCTAAAGAGGNYTTTVRVAGRRSDNTGNGTFSYNAPTVSGCLGGTGVAGVSFMGSSGAAIDLLTVSGTGFGVDADILAVSFYNSTTESFACGSIALSQDHTELTCQVPPAATLNLTIQYDVIVTAGVAADGTAISSAPSGVTFEYLAPTIASITRVSHYGGSVRIVGTNLGGVGSFLLGLAVVKADNVTFTSQSWVSISNQSDAGLGNVEEAQTVVNYTFPNWNDIGLLNPTDVRLVIGAEYPQTTNALALDYLLPNIDDNLTIATTGDAFGQSQAFQVFGARLAPDENQSPGQIAAWTTDYLDALYIDGEAIPDVKSGCSITYETATNEFSESSESQRSVIVLCYKSTASLCSPRKGENLNFTVGVNGLNTTAGGVARFSFRKPAISAVQGPQTPGGTLTVTGSGFGPEAADGCSSTFLDSVMVCEDQACASAIATSSCLVTVQGAQLTCTLAGGSNAVGTNITVTVDGQESARGEQYFSYQPPTVDTSTSPPNSLPTTGGGLVVAGLSFGPASSAGDGRVEVNVTGFDATGAALVIQCRNAYVATADTEIRCTLDPGAGADLDVGVHLFQEGRSIAYGNPNSAFSYVEPTLISTNLVPTEGGNLTLTGTNFGPVGSAFVGSVTADDLSATQCNVTTAHTEMVCSMPAGTSGTGHEVTVDLNGNGLTSAYNNFDYEAPSVTAVVAKPGMLGASTLTFNGSSLGNAAGVVTVEVLDAGGSVIATCSDVQLDVAHTTVSCTVPTTSGSGLGPFDTALVYDLRVSVDGQNNGATGVPLLEFEGPVITSVDDISMFASSTGMQLSIHGRNFGRWDGSSSSDGSKIERVRVCEFTFEDSDCGAGDYEEVAGTVEPSANYQDQTIVTSIVARTGARYSVQVAISNAETSSPPAAVEAESTGGDRSFSYLAPVITGAIGDGFSGSATLFTGLDSEGGVLRIQGENFGPQDPNPLNPPANILSLIWDGDDSAVDVNSCYVNTATSEILCTVPGGVGTAPFAVNMTCCGTTSESQSTALSNVAYFRYNAPTVTGVTSVGTQGGRVTIDGTSFGAVGSANVDRIYFQAVDNSIFECIDPNVTIADIEVKCTLGAGSGQAVSVYVVIAGQTSSGGTQRFAYEGPVIESVASLPTSGDRGFVGWNGAEGAWVVITGRNFGPVTNLLPQVTVGGVSCTNSRVTVADTEVQALLGKGVGSGYDVVFSVLGQSTGSSGDGNFTFDPPAVYNFTSAKHYGGETITVQGINFGCKSNAAFCVLPNDPLLDLTVFPTPSVTIDGHECTDVTLTESHTELTCVAPTRLDGGSLTDLPLLVTQEGQISAAKQFTYEPPAVGSIPAVSQFGGNVTLYGTALGPVGDALVDRIYVATAPVDLDLYPAVVTVANTELSWIVPPGQGVGLDVRMVIGGQGSGTSGTDALTYIGPRITRVLGAPTEGGIATIIGENFGPLGSGFVVSVRTGGAVAGRDGDGLAVCSNGAVTVEDTEIECEVPAGSGAGLDMALTVWKLDDAGTGVGVFNYAPPQILVASPSDVPTGEDVTFIGTSLGADLSLLEVQIGNVSCTELRYATPHTEVVCTTPLRQTGESKEVTIVYDGQVAVFGGFGYSQPRVESVSTLPPSGGMLVIEGYNLGPINASHLLKVSVGGIRCAKPEVVVSYTLITCTMPPGHAGGLDVVVTVDDQDSGDSGAGLFSYSAPVVRGISPLNSDTPIKEGFEVTILGEHFGSPTDTPEIAIDGVSTFAAYILNDGELRFTAPAASGTNLTVEVWIDGRAAIFDFPDGLSPRADWVPPVVTAAEGPGTPGGVATIGGYGFGVAGNRSDIEVFVEDVGPCVDVVVISDGDMLSCITGPGTGADHAISIVVGGQNGSMAPGLGGFTFQRPLVTLVDPPFGEAGDRIRVSGINFGTDSALVQVYVKGVACQNIRLREIHTELRCEVPIQVGKDLEVSVVVDTVGSETAGPGTIVPPERTFEYPPPVIYSVSGAGTAGDLIEIEGDGFGVAGDAYRYFFQYVMVGGRACNDAKVVKNSTTLVCYAPAGAGTGLDVVVAMNGVDTNQTGAGLFSYYPPLVLTVARVPTNGGVVLIDGANFGPAADASVHLTIAHEGGRAVGVTSPAVSLDNTQISANVGPGGGGGYPLDLVVNGQNATCAEAIAPFFNRSYNVGPGSPYEGFVPPAYNFAEVCTGVSGSTALSFAYEIPIVESVSPSKQSGDVHNPIITITGRNFGTAIGDVRVFVGERESARLSLRLLLADLDSDDLYSEVTAMVPTGEGHKSPVRVEILGQRNLDVNTGVYSYGQPYIVGSTSAPTSGGDVLIYGNNFGPNDMPVKEVLIDGKLCTGARVVAEHTTIRCTAAPGTGKALDIKVTLSDNEPRTTMLNGRGKFRYRRPSRVFPRLTAAGNGTRVSIGGLNLGDDATLVRVSVANFSAPPLSEAIDVAYARTAAACPQDVPAGAYCGESGDGSGDGGFAPYDLLAGSAVEATGVRVEENHTSLSFEMPLAVGEGLRIRVEIGGQLDEPSAAGAISQAISYPAPVITSVSRPPTRGGAMEIHGENFGPLGSRAVDSITLSYPYEEDVFGNKQFAVTTCDNGTVSTVDAIITCDVPMGQGRDIDVRLVVAGQSSGLSGEEAMRFRPPRVATVQPAVARAGEVITITGFDFGPGAASEAAGPYPQSAWQFDGLRVAIGGANAPAVVVIEPHGTIHATVPVGAGTSHTAIVYASNQRSEQIPGVSAETFSYPPPVVEFATGSNTAGGDVNITGYNFGRVGSFAIDWVMVGEREVESCRVVVPDTVMTCFIGPGQGSGANVTVSVGGQISDDTGAYAFSYAPPRVLGIGPPAAYPGEEITVYGGSFGADVSRVSVFLGGEPCNVTGMPETHTAVTCVVGKHEGKGLAAVVVVEDLMSDWELDGIAFTYRKDGCLDPASSNFDHNATDADGSCVLYGCTNVSKHNFDPGATADDGSCVEPPIKIAFTLDADFATYTASPDAFEANFLADLAANTGLPANRFHILSVVAGSIVVTFEVTDAPEDREDRAVAVVAHINGLVETAKFGWLNNTDAELLYVHNDFDEKSGEFVERTITQASEPLVSMDSIIAVGVGVGIMLLWAACWRLGLVACIKSMCDGRGAGGADQAADSELLAEKLEAAINGTPMRPKSLRVLKGGVKVTPTKQDEFIGV